MNKISRWFSPAAGLLLMLGVNTAFAGEVQIKAAEFRRSADNSWYVSVTLQHADSGWDHYADDWRVVDSAGKVLGDRVLYHPHVDEQPFTRGLGGVVVPEGVTTVYIEAHDKVHGWSPHKLEVDLSKVKGGRLRVEA